MRWWWWAFTHHSLLPPPPPAGAVLCLALQTRSSERRKVCRGLLSARPIGHLPAHRTPRHGRPLTFFQNKDPSDTPPHTHTLNPSSGRRMAAILEEFIRCVLKRIWLKCRLNLLWVRLEECHLFTKRMSNSFFIWYSRRDTQTPPPCLQLTRSQHKELFDFCFYFLETWF